MNLNELVNQAFTEVDLESIVKDKLKSSIKKSIESAIDDQFRYSGAGSKLIDKAFKEMQLPESVDVIDYREFMIECCTESLAQYKTPEHKKRIQEFIKDRMGDAEVKEMSIDSLVEKLQEQYAESEYGEDCCGTYGETGLKITVEQEPKYDWFNIDVYEDDSKVAHLTVSSSRDFKAFSSRNEKYCNSGADILFKSLAYHKVAITDLEEEEYTYTREDHIESRY